MSSPSQSRQHESQQPHGQQGEEETGTTSQIPTDNNDPHSPRHHHHHSSPQQQQQQQQHSNIRHRHPHRHPDTSPVGPGATSTTLDNADTSLGGSHSVISGSHTTTGTSIVVCPICIQDINVGDTVFMLQTCEHVFHKDCLVRWICTNSRDCPYCRRELISQPMLDEAFRRRNGRQLQLQQQLRHQHF